MRGHLVDKLARTVEIELSGEGDDGVGVRQFGQVLAEQIGNVGGSQDLRARQDQASTANEQVSKCTPRSVPPSHSTYAATQ